MTTTYNLAADIIDVRDIIARVEELETIEPQTEEEKFRNVEEYADLLSILEELEGNGGDEQWRGDWYPITLIDAQYFVTYVQELLVDCGEIPKNLPFYVHIDWEATARDVGMDYTSLTINGREYFYR
jgi:hypothetical protein